jgi:hypothetical protein
VIAEVYSSNVLPPLGLPPPLVESRHVVVMPCARGPRSRYRGQGLRGRKVGAGTYRFWRVDGRPLDAVSVLVRVAPPWIEQSVSTWVRECTTHAGTACDGSSDDCRTTWRRARVPAWYALARFRDPRTFEVFTCRRSSSRTKGTWKVPEPSSGAGFYVLLTSRAAKSRRRYPGDERGGES